MLELQHTSPGTRLAHAGDGIVPPSSPGGFIMSLLRIIQAPAQPQADLKRVYDAIVIGSGAAGGMAAHVLTSQGMKVLMLEAGKKLDIDKELKSMEWPFQHP